MFGLTGDAPLRTFETVPTETLAFFATSLVVAIIVSTRLKRIRAHSGRKPNILDSGQN